ncbi:MAG: DMT family transporter [Gammaproteobacteria bacterium]|nr:DMT family transporter [Gammaproteobacteria bacterium]
MGLAEWALLVILSILWGGSFFFAEVALQEFSPLAIVTLRVTISAFALWAFILPARYPLPGSWRTWLAFLWLGIVNNAVPFSLIVWGQTGVSSSLASILNAATPIFTVIVAGLFLKDEPVTLPKIAGVLSGLAGVAILVGPGLLANGDSQLPYQLAVLGGGLSYAIAAVYARRFAGMNIAPVVIAAAQLLASTIVMWPLLLAVEGPGEWRATAPVWLSVFGLALLSTAVAYILYFKVLESAGATNLLLVTLLIPVTATLLGILFLGEALHWTHAAGIGVIAIGLSAIDGRLWRR